MISSFRKLVSMVTPRRKASRIALVVVGVWWVAMMVRGVRMALPEGLSTSSPERGVARLDGGICSLDRFRNPDFGVRRER